MLRKITMTMMVMALAISCGNGTKKAKTEDEETATSKTKDETKTKTKDDDIKPPVTVEVFDKKSKPPELQKAVPAKAAIDGWVKKPSEASVAKPSDLPANLPAKNTEFYRVEKNIDGKVRSVSVVYGNIVKETDAIVNAANNSLGGGGGVDGAIHNEAKIDGVDFMLEEKDAYFAFHGIKSLPTGSAMVMNPYNLKKNNVKMIVNTAGPTTENLLELYSSVYNSLVKAAEYGAKSVSIPAISTGIFGFPVEKATPLYFIAVFQYFADNPKTSIENIRFTNFDKPKVEKVAEEFLKLFP